MALKQWHQQARDALGSQSSVLMEVCNKIQQGLETMWLEPIVGHARNLQQILLIDSDKVPETSFALKSLMKRLGQKKHDLTEQDLEELITALINIYKLQTQSPRKTGKQERKRKIIYDYDDEEDLDQKTNDEDDPHNEDTEDTEDTEDDQDELTDFILQWQPTVYESPQEPNKWVVSVFLNDSQNTIYDTTPSQLFHSQEEAENSLHIFDALIQPHNRPQVLQRLVMEAWLRLHSNGYCSFQMGVHSFSIVYDQTEIGSYVLVFASFAMNVFVLLSNMVEKCLTVSQQIEKDVIVVNSGFVSCAKPQEGGLVYILLKTSSAQRQHIGDVIYKAL